MVNWRSIPKWLRDLESHFHWNGDVFSDGKIIDTAIPGHGNPKVIPKPPAVSTIRESPRRPLQRR